MLADKVTVRPITRSLKKLENQTLVTPLRYGVQNLHIVGSCFCGQAKEALKLTDDESVDCVVTSPPYFWLRDYQVDGQVGMEESVDEYVDAISDVMSEIFRVLKPQGTVFLNLGDTYYSGKGESQGVDRKNSKRRFGLRAVDKSRGLGIDLKRKSTIGIPWRVAIKMCQQKVGASLSDHMA